MLCRSLSWMGCAGLAAAPAVREVTVGGGEEEVVGVGVGEAAVVATGVMGVVGTWEALRRLVAKVEVGVTAVEGLRGRKRGRRERRRRGGRGGETKSAVGSV